MYDTVFLFPLCSESGSVWWLWLWQCRAGSVRQRRAQPPPECWSVGTAISTLSGVSTGAPYRTSVDHLDTSKDLWLPYSEQPSQAYTNLSVQYITVVMRDHTYYTIQTMTSWLMVSHKFVGWQTYIRWHRAFVITWHQLFWQLVTSDKCHLSSVGFFLGRIVTKVTLATAPVQQKPFHRRTHKKIPHL